MLSKRPTHGFIERVLVQAFSLVLCFSLPMLAQKILPASPLRDIDTLRHDDDTDHPVQITPEAIAEYEQRGRGRSQEVRVLLTAGQLKSPEDLYKAAFVLQHGETADDYLMAHVLATESLVKGNLDARWLVAATLDRYLQLTRQPQIFGTQYSLDPTKPHPVNAEQKARFSGRTQSPYNHTFLPEFIRADFCVPTIAQQKRNLDTLNSGKYPSEGMLPAGCKR